MKSVVFFGALTATLTILKLFGLISWQWWLVLFPVWLPMASLIGAFIVMIIVASWAVFGAVILGNKYD